VYDKVISGVFRQVSERRLSGVDQCSLYVRNWGDCRQAALIQRQLAPNVAHWWKADLSESLVVGKA
jgi:hypothetical protein